MTIDTAVPARLASEAFAPDEPVLQSHPLISGATVPAFADTTVWPMNAVRKPANLPWSNWKLNLSFLEPVWNLRTREIAMALLNPEHPVVQDAGLHLGEPADPRTVCGLGYRMAALADWAGRRGLPAALPDWQLDDARAFIDHRRGETSAASVRNDVGLIRLLHQFGPLLTGGGLAADPWPGKTSRQVAKVKRKAVSTANIQPELWFALVKAAWTYVHDLAPDILTAQRRYQELLDASVRDGRDLDERLDAYLADPANKIPVHTAAAGLSRAGQVNWNLLSVLVGAHPDYGFHSNRSSQRVQRLRARVLAEASRTVAGGLLARHRNVVRRDGTTGPWHPGLCPRTLPLECIALRGAAYILVAATSMMRDSEIREITRGSVVEYYGAPAVVSVKRKHDPDRPREHWWITEPVAEAIAVAEALSTHPDLVFVADRGRYGEGFTSSVIVRSFITHVNKGTDHHGLHIPPGRATPQMFRKTMAMLTGIEPGAEIALGIQLKHAVTRVLANRVTQGYAASDTNWAKLLDTALDEARFAKLSEFYDDHHAGKTIGFGPGADRLTATFDAIKQSAHDLVDRGAARQGDARVEYDLLRKARISIRFGQLNHCTLDKNNPAGAKCMEGDVIIPGGHRGPLIDRCQPDRCANSIIGPAHLPIWKAEKTSLLKLLSATKLPPARRALLERQHQDVQAVIDRAESGDRP
jgi:hypothetical protein